MWLGEVGLAVEETEVVRCSHRCLFGWAYDDGHTQQLVEALLHGNRVAEEGGDEGNGGRRATQLGG